MSAISGPIDVDGDAGAREVLREAWRSARGDGRGRTHGFHPWPARLHPDVAGHLIDSLSRPGDLVVDPFAGSGTVPVEAVARGRRGAGSDVNPIALAIARARGIRLDRGLRGRIEATAERIARAAGRARPEPVPRELARLLDSKTYSELRSIARRIEPIRHEAVGFVLQQVLSSLVIRVSRRRAETDPARTPRAPGRAARRFLDRTRELCLGHRDLWRAAGDTPPPLVVAADARALPFRDRVADLVLTSPPYLGTYDYAGIQEERARLLGIDLSIASRREIGARSRARRDPRGERVRYEKALRESLREIRRILREGGACAVVIGDPSAGEGTLSGHEIVARAASGTGLRVIARASEAREGPPRRNPAASRGSGAGPGREHERPREHIVLLVSR